LTGNLAEMRQTTALGLAPTVYPDAAVFDRELRELFGHSWLLVGRADEIAEVGAFFTWQRTRIPFVLIRAVDGQIRAFYNSCRHRGAPVVRTPTGRARAFRCQYHSWTYDTFGRLLAVPDERDFGEVDRCAYFLVPLPVTELGGWLWVNQDRSAATLAQTLGPAAAELERLGAGLRSTEREVVTVDSNWKPVVERLADFAANPSSAGGRMVVSQLPNLFFIETPAELQAVAAWPVDEATTSVEVVRCANGPSAADDPAWQAGWDDLDARLQLALGWTRHADSPA